MPRRLLLGAGLIDDDVPVIATVGIGRTRHVQVTDEYVENVTHADVCLLTPLQNVGG